uniref:histone acetyltransferase n=1 Tax=Tetraselmis chuii TaxID=63592 RepID=A0A6U1GV64_9CHLO|mmetsp:Transcript_24478/g.43553  ORF Transcript_24478/g.43553 Transcript_24478/m.43553 type:complete len:537 (+) Transcript_24478:1311-2921(+)
MAPSSEGAVGQAAAADQPAVSTSPPAVAPLAPDEPETLVLDEGNVHSVGAGGECGASGRETAAASTAGRGSGGPVDSSAAVGPSAVALHEATDGLQGDQSKDWRVASYEVGSKVLCTAIFDNQQRLAQIVDQRYNTGDGLFSYYVHYVDFDKRLDEWVSVSRLQPFTPGVAPSEPLMSPRLGGGAGELLSPVSQERKLTRKLKRRYEEVMHVQKGVEDLPPIDQTLEREHHERTKVKNIMMVEMGKYEMDAWYFSPFPEAYANQDKLYVCEFCLKYMKKKKTLLRHRAKCAWTHPPGDEIYRSPPPPLDNPSFTGGPVFNPPVSMFEVDGKANKIYCQNLCLLSKLFLDHKTLYYDVDPFLFYILTEQDSAGHHVVGYFSKEKASQEEYNLACILTLPPHQRKGYGRFLITFSYELSKKEGRVGTPERPLSDLGQVSYRSYWTRVLLDILKEHKGNLSIKDISQMTSFRADDIVTTLQSLNLIKYWKGQHIISVTPRVLEEHLKPVNGQRYVSCVDPSRIHWAPLLSPRTASKKPK